MAKRASTPGVSAPSDDEVVLTRLFNAPRQLVFDVMSQPEHVKRWWGNLGEGYSVPVCEIDFRVGGKWRFVNTTRRASSESGRPASAAVAKWIGEERGGLVVRGWWGRHWSTAGAGIDVH